MKAFVKMNMEERRLCLQIARMLQRRRYAERTVQWCDKVSYRIVPRSRKELWWTKAELRKN
jgi:hypothetical protein